MNIHTIATEAQNIQNEYGCDFNTVSDYPILHSHEFFEIAFIFSDMTHHINGITYTLNADSIVIIRPQDIHMFTDCAEKIGQLNFKVSVSLFHMLCDFFDDSFYDDILQKELHMLYCKASSDCKQKAYEFLMRFSSIKDRKNQYIFCKFLVTDFLEDYYVQMYFAAKPAYGAIPKLVQESLEIMSDPQNFSSNLTDLLSGLGNSYMHVYRLFMTHLNRNPNSFFVEQKLLYSASLLRYSEFKIVDIANMSGFSSQSRFDIAFKKMFNMTPQQYRLRNRS